MLKLGKGVDDGEIVDIKKIRIKTREINILEKELFYKYKLYMYRDLFLKIKRKKKIKLTKQIKIYPQYFKMHKFLENYIKEI